MPYRHRVTVLLAAAALATAAALLTFAAAAGAADVTIANKAFGPNAAAIAPGQSVTWHWGDGPHNVHTTAGPEQFDSGIKTAGSSYTHAFTAAGVYTYQCDVHPSMHGQVVVGGAAAAAPAPAPSAVVPRLASVRVSRLAVVQVTSTAPATLVVRIARGARTVKRTAVRTSAGTSRVPLPVRSLALGRYRLELTALDATGRPVGKAIRALTVTRAARARRPGAPVLATPAPLTAAAPGPSSVADDHRHGGRLD